MIEPTTELEQSWPFDTAVQSTLRYTRDDTRIHSAVQQHHEQLLKSLIEAGKTLPAVLYAQEMETRDAGVADDIARLQLDLEQLELDRKKAVADLRGTALAEKLAKIDASKNKLNEKIATCRTGERLFRQEVAEANGAAYRAVEAFVAAKWPQLLSETNHAADLAKAIATTLPAEVRQQLDEAVIRPLVADMMQRRVGITGLASKIIHPEEKQ